MKNGKRILKVTVKRMFDDSTPDSSHLGEYSSSASSQFSIDRAHALDCPCNNAWEHQAQLDSLERAISELNAQTYDTSLSDAQRDSIQDAQNLLIEAQENVQACTCDYSGHWDSREYRYFNPSFNYVDKNGKAKDLEPAEVAKYVRQDYARMESLNSGDWCYVGIRAEAEYTVESGLVQDVSSGGLWGIESDSDEEYFAEVAQEELSELRKQLSAIGFSKRAIATAVKNVEHVQQ